MNAFAETTDTGNLLVRLWYCVDNAHVQDLIDKAFRACPEETQLEIIKDLYQYAEHGLLLDKHYFTDGTKQEVEKRLNVNGLEDLQ